ADTADLRDLLTDLGLGQHPAQARLGPLAELDLDGPYRGSGHQLLEAGQVEGAVLVAAAEVGGADLEDQVGTVAVVPRDPTLTGVVQHSGGRASPVDRLHRRCRQRAETHRRDVDDRLGPESASAATGRTDHL